MQEQLKSRNEIVILLEENLMHYSEQWVFTYETKSKGNERKKRNYIT